MYINERFYINEIFYIPSFKFTLGGIVTGVIADYSVVSNDTEISHALYSVSPNGNIIQHYIVQQGILPRILTLTQSTHLTDMSLVLRYSFVCF